MLFPHYLFLCTSSFSSQQADGTWSESTPSLSFVCRCREEANSKGQEVPIANTLYHHVQSANASFRRFASVVYLPKGTLKIPIGTTIMVCNDAQGTEVRLQANVQKYDQGQLHCRLWT